MIQTTAASPIPSLTGSYSYYNNVKYGKYNRQSIDLFTPTSGTPTGVVLFFHGGGFVSGTTDPSTYAQVTIDKIQNYLNNNIAYGWVNYRLMSNDEERYGVTNSLNCGIQAIDFMISNATNFNLDTSKICLVGSSGGNGLIMQYLHYGTSNINSVLLQSPQASYDPLEWNNILSEEGFDVINEMETNSFTKKTLLRGVGLKNINDLYKPEVVIDRASYNYVNLPMSVTIGEAYVETLNQPSTGDVTNQSHHYKQCISIQNKFISEGFTSNLNIPTAPSPYTEINVEDAEDFIIRTLS